MLEALKGFGSLIAPPGNDVIKEKKQRRDRTMNWDQIEGNWKQLKGKAKQQWGKLTDDELEIIAGKKDQLIGKLQERYGFRKEDAEHVADQWVKAC